MEHCGFFDANLEGEEYDRVYLAQNFAAYFASFIANGVYAEHSNQLQVMSMPTPQMKVSVESGQGWINGYWYENTSSLQLSFDIADGVLNRIDSVVLRLGFAERDMWLAVKKGTPATNPVAPPVTRNADYYELQLATISIPASSIRITQAQITDTRMVEDVCGWVTGVIQQIDTTTLFEQFEAYFAEFKENQEADFEAWFERMKDQLSTDAAGHLQNEIDDVNEDLAALESSLKPMAYVDYTPSGTVSGSEGIVLRDKHIEYESIKAIIDGVNHDLRSDIIALYNESKKIFYAEIREFVIPLSGLTSSVHLQNFQTDLPASEKWYIHSGYVESNTKARFPLTYVQTTNWNNSLGVLYHGDSGKIEFNANAAWGSNYVAHVFMCRMTS